VEKWGGKKSACASRARAGRRTCLDWGFGVLSRPTVCCGKRLSFLLGHENWTQWAIFHRYVKLPEDIQVSGVPFAVPQCPVSATRCLVRCIRPQDFYPTSWKPQIKPGTFGMAPMLELNGPATAGRSPTVAIFNVAMIGHVNPTFALVQDWYALRGVTLLGVARGKWVIYNGRPLNFGTTGCANLVIYRITWYR
jgi:hypothetical protein